VRPLKLYTPELFAVVVAVDVPLSETVAPPPLLAGAIVPEIVKVGLDCAVAVKLIPVMSPPFTVAACVPGLKV
jgi:hypothetical protein